MKRKTKSSEAKQAQAIGLLLTGNSTAEVASQIGVTQRTVQNWCSDDMEFIAQLRSAESEAVTVASRRLASVASSAIDTIEEIMSHPLSKAPTRLQAADLALSYLFRFRDIVSIETRLAALEESIKHVNEKY